MARTARPPAKPKVTSAKTSRRPLNRAGTANADATDLEGKTAPDFTLPDQNGKPVSLQDLTRHGDVVLYFYPKDMTPGCTNEACSFRDKLDLLRAAGAQVVGVSADSPASHQKFIQKNGLTFPLLSDSGNEIGKMYGVYKQKSLYGRQFMGIERSTFIIGRDSTVRHVFSKVKVNGHAEQVLSALTERS
jgi:thioredoxin-dependent peroxiredoxin